MTARLLLVGKKFGRLKVKKCVGVDKHRNLIWLCICRCGATSRVRGLDLKSGATKSCGCLHKEVARKNIEEKYRAKRRVRRRSARQVNMTEVFESLRDKPRKRV